MKGFERTIFRGQRLIFDAFLLVVLGLYLLIKGGLEWWYLTLFSWLLAVILFFIGKSILKEGQKEEREYNEYLELKQENDKKSS